MHNPGWGPCYNPVFMLSDTPPNPEELLGPLKLTPQRRAWITAGVMMGLFLSALEATAVVTAMPTVISSLGGLELYSWVYSIYFLTATVSVPLWGRLSDFYGRRLFYIAGIGLFVGGSVLCGLSQSMVQLVAFRAIQGLGAGALLPLGMTIVGDIYSLERRARMQGWFSGVWGLSSILGPLLGGLITDHFSWRWVFFLNIPFGLLAGTIIALALVEPRNRRDSRVDYLGVLLLLVSLSLLLISLDQFKDGEPTLGQVLALIMAVVLLALFVFQQRKTVDPILPLHLFNDRMFSAAALNGLFSGMALFGAISFIPLFVQGVLGTGATEAGWAITPLMLGWVVFSIIGGRLILIVGYRRTVIAGMVSLSIGFFLLSRITAQVSPLQLGMVLVLMGTGMGLSMVSMLIAVQNRFPRSYLGIATSATQFFRTIGASIGIAIMGAVMAGQMMSGLSAMEATEQTEQIAYVARHLDMMVNPLNRAQISPDLLPKLQELLGMALQDVFFVGFIFSLLALASAFLVPPGSAQQNARRK